MERQKLQLSYTRFRRRTSQELNRMLMRANKGFGSAHVEHGV